MKISTLVVASVCFSGLFLHVSCHQALKNAEDANLAKVDSSVSKNTQNEAELAKEKSTSLCKAGDVIFSCVLKSNDDSKNRIKLCRNEKDLVILYNDKLLYKTHYTLATPTMTSTVNLNNYYLTIKDNNKSYKFYSYTSLNSDSVIKASVELPNNSRQKCNYEIAMLDKLPILVDALNKYTPLSNIEFLK